MHFGFNNQFKSQENIGQNFNNKKILFCLSFSIQGMTLHVIHIPDIKLFFLR
jgi:hypothetical protein